MAQIGSKRTKRGREAPEGHQRKPAIMAAAVRQGLRKGGGLLLQGGEKVQPSSTSLTNTDESRGRRGGAGTEKRIGTCDALPRCGQVVVLCWVQVTGPGQQCTRLPAPQRGRSLSKGQVKPEGGCTAAPAAARQVVPRGLSRRAGPPTRIAAQSQACRWLLAKVV